MYPERVETYKEVNLGGVLAGLFHRQGQYLVRYFDRQMTKEGYDYLGENLRIKGDAGNYSDMTIAEEDLPEAVKRLQKVVEKSDNTEKKSDESKPNADFLPPWARP